MFVIEPKPPILLNFLLPFFFDEIFAMNFTQKKEPMTDHEKFKDLKDKHSKFFSEKPGK